MKASDVTVPGFYWADGNYIVEAFEDESNGKMMFSDTSAHVTSAEHTPGVLIGPLQPPGEDEIPPLGDDFFKNAKRGREFFAERGLQPPGEEPQPVAYISAESFAELQQRQVVRAVLSIHAEPGDVALIARPVLPKEPSNGK